MIFFFPHSSWQMVRVDGPGTQKSSHSHEYSVLVTFLVEGTHRQTLQHCESQPHESQQSPARAEAAPASKTSAQQMSDFMAVGSRKLSVGGSRNRGK